MKKICSWGLLLILCMLFFSFQKIKENHGLVDVKDMRKMTSKTEVPKPKLPNEITVSRTSKFYKMYYCTEAKTVYSGSYGSKDDFDKAEFHWLNDSCVAIELYQFIIGWQKNKN